MIKKATIQVTLGIKGPILCKATAPSSWGIDASFDRNFEGDPFIDRSHIKGKLREALNELGVDKGQTNEWLGKADSKTARLMISDFFCKDKPAGNLLGNKLTRIRMDRDRGVVDETALLFMENAFPLRDKPYEWKGSIEFFAKDDTEAKDIHKEISAGLKWISAFGAEKSVGFGKLVRVVATLKEPLEDISIPSPFPAPEKESEWITITIEPEDPLLMGGVKKPKANYMETEKIISGALIKGTLAETLNLVSGHPVPSRIPIDDKNLNVIKLYPELVKYFDHIRFTHAFPTIGSTRPVVIPYSAVVASGAHYDVALCEKARTIHGEAPKFQLDWKDDEFPNDFGWAFPRLLFKTRTAIDKDSRGAEENKMFTYQYVCPVDKDKNKVVWRGQAWIPDLAVQAELLNALNRIERLGKRRSRVKVTAKLGRWGHAQEEESSLKDGIAIVTLQSDALMVNPDDLINHQTAEKLHKLYADYWPSKPVSDGSLEMHHFFAHQRLLGGYLACKARRGSRRYYPFYLTGAGSVFVLRAKDETKAIKKIENWKKNGLPLPGWAEKKYGGNGKDNVWKTCPFIPQNGYGEITVNLKWHFEEKLESDVEGGAS